ncbi:hypothetical protein NH340_JMT09161 [Sarcoptes scabiei]|uniref:Uncharacterized protein n=1 Tax=Sarcoptes scabiei TaxID=52283 RepID=A0A834R290_SARSC|nr:hypothetical protein NH340_JMT09161 [Sarcoptes scabiei]
MFQMIHLLLATTVAMIISLNVCLIESRILASTEPPTFLTDQLSRWFSFEFNNMQKMADLAMNPVIESKTLLQLYNEANSIVNVTGADSVLLEIDQINESFPSNELLSSSSSSASFFNSNLTHQTDAINVNKSLMVLAVANPNVPSHEDLMKKFNLYYVNLTESNQDELNRTQTIQNDSSSTTKPLAYQDPTVWQIFIDFIRNQANAIIGALMIPIKVSSNAILKSTQTHAEYVMSGSSFGSVVSAPIILKSISIPNIISQHVVDITADGVNGVESAMEQTQTIADGAIQSLASGINDGGHFVSESTTHYVVRPIGAFTGFHLDRAGSNIEQIGKSFANTGLNIHLFGERIGDDAKKVVSAGATAIAWGLDDTVKFNPNS